MVTRFSGGLRTGSFFLVVSGYRDAERYKRGVLPMKKPLVVRGLCGSSGHSKRLAEELEDLLRLLIREREDGGA